MRQRASAQMQLIRNRTKHQILLVMHFAILQNLQNGIVFYTALFYRIFFEQLSEKRGEICLNYLTAPVVGKLSSCGFKQGLNALILQNAGSAGGHSIEHDYNLVSVGEVEKLAGGDASGIVQR